MSDWNDAIQAAAKEIDRWDWYSMGMPKEISPEHIEKITDSLSKHISNLKRPAEMEGGCIDQVRKIIRKLHYMSKISQPKEAAWDIPYMTALADVERELPTLPHSEGDKR